MVIGLSSFLYVRSSNGREDRKEEATKTIASSVPSAVSVTEEDVHRARMVRNASLCANDGGTHWLEMEGTTVDPLIICSDGKRLWFKRP